MVKMYKEWSADIVVSFEAYQTNWFMGLLESSIPQLDLDFIYSFSMQYFYILLFFHDLFYLLSLW